LVDGLYNWEFTDGLPGSSDNQPQTSRFIDYLLAVRLTVSDGHCEDYSMWMGINHCPMTIYVPDDYETIQEAVDNAASGDTIIVRDGIYQENVDVYINNLTIMSENGSANCIIQAANPNDHVFEVTSDYVNISGFTVKGATEGYWVAGIYLGNTDLCTMINDTNISNCNISNNNNGIYASYSSNNTISNCFISHNNMGIQLYTSSGNLISNCSIRLNNYSGMELWLSSDNNCIFNNTISNNGWSGIWIDCGSSNNSIYRNIISCCDIGIVISIECPGSTINNIIYNNYFNNSKNVWDWGNNIWNITKIAGRNIVDGSYLGGNYWSDYAGEDLVVS
jgi:parallel beta-helix repeat protein